MGKTAPLKKKSGKHMLLTVHLYLSLTPHIEASVHSRAAKRASSPSIDLDKSLKNVKLPTDSKGHRPSVLAIHQGAGVTKKSKNGRKSVLSTKAKRRQEKGLDRAEAVMDKKEKKIEKSRGRAKNVQDRARAWEDLNNKLSTRKAKGGAVLQDEWVEEVDAIGMEDVEVEETAKVEEVTVTELIPSGVMAVEEIAKAVPLPEPVEEEDEIL